MLLINKVLLKMSKGVRGWILAITAIRLAILYATIEFSKVIAGFLGDLYNPSLTFSDFESAIVSALIFSLLLTLGNVLLGEAEYYCSAKSRLSLRNQILGKILEIDVSYIESIGPSSAVNTAGQGIENMQLYYTKYLPTLLFCIISPFYFFWQLSDISFVIAMILALVSFLILPVNNVFKHVTEQLKGDYWNSLENMTSYYLENLKGLTTFKLFNRDEDRSKELKVRVDDFNVRVMEVMKVNFYSVAITYCLIYLSIFIVLMITAYQLYYQQFTLAQGLTILLLSYSFFNAFNQLVSATHNALSGIAASQNIYKLLSVDTSRKTLPAKQIDEHQVKMGIEIKNISYAYPNRDNVLNDLSMYIPQGKITALVGSSGCGKSTIASLLLRFIDPKNGQIELNGEDYLCLKIEDLRKKIIIVPQSVSIFSGTIEDNLKLANPSASHEEMYKALNNVRLLEWVKSLPLGLQNDVGDGGSKLSGGQKQKIGIARALLSNAEYIVLDEATSSVDMQSEKEIWHCIAELSTHKTLIIISHRLSSIRNADQIYVLDKGKIDSQGNHNQLMDASILYRTLVNEQEKLENLGRKGEDHE